MFWQIFGLSVIIMIFVVLGLGIQTFFSSKKRFPETRIGHNKAMRERKIYCPRTMQVRIDKGIDDSFSSCESCF